MSKKVFIINGTGGSGKDTFVNFVGTKKKIYNYSSVDIIKQIATFGGWTGGKTEKDRKFLSELKSLFMEYNDLSFQDLEQNYKYFKANPNLEICFFHIREPEEIERAVKHFNAQAVLVVNKNIQDISSNSADERVYDYTYDYLIDNSGSLDDLKESVETFIKTIYEA